MTTNDSDLLKQFVSEETTTNGVTYAGDDVLYVDENELDSRVGMGWMHIENMIDLLLTHKTKREHWRDWEEARAEALDNEQYAMWAAELDNQALEEAGTGRM